jgi:hypothetical protein
MTQSPIVKAHTLMDWPDAMRALKGGAKITRIEWNNDDYCQRWDGWLMVNKDGTWHTWQVSAADMDATDWTIYSQDSHFIH